MPSGEIKLDLPVLGRFVTDVDEARAGLESLAAAHEAKEVDGEFGEYVWSCSAGTNREPRRITRTIYLCRALRGELL